VSQKPARSVKNNSGVTLAASDASAKQQSTPSSVKGGLSVGHHALDLILRVLGVSLQDKKGAASRRMSPNA
jgi:hypothetical protein